jgi:hypothetical protein
MILTIGLCFVPSLSATSQANVSADPVQTYVDAIRMSLVDGKANLIDTTMRLSDGDAEVFWPLYVDYEVDLFEIGDRRLDLIQWFVAAHRADILDDREAAQMAAEWFEQETARLELLKKYHGLVADALSPRHAIQFVQIEHRVNTVIDLMIASQLPLFRYGETPVGSAESRTAPSEKAPQTIALKASWQGDYPVDALRRLPIGQRETATGYITDAATFASVWRAFRPDEVVPHVDFEQDLVVFARNVNFYNRTRIATVQIKDGVLQVLAVETMSAHPIEDKVAMALAVIPRKDIERIPFGKKGVAVE